MAVQAVSDPLLFPIPILTSSLPRPGPQQCKAYLSNFDQPSQCSASYVLRPSIIDVGSFRRSIPWMKLRNRMVSYKDGEIEIIGNRGALKFLGDICLCLKEL
jgi:hypothetical protein